MKLITTLIVQNTTSATNATYLQIKNVVIVIKCLLIRSYSVSTSQLISLDGMTVECAFPPAQKLIYMSLSITRKTSTVLGIFLHNGVDENGNPANVLIQTATFCKPVDLWRYQKHHCIWNIHGYFVGNINVLLLFFLELVLTCRYNID